MTLRSKLIRLAYAKPHLRTKLLPLIKVARDKSSTLAQVQKLAEKGKPWDLLISSVEGGSFKFWRASGMSMEEPVAISWGRIGGDGRSIMKDWAYFEKAVPLKLNKGYIYGMPKRTPDMLAAEYSEAALKILVKKAVLLTKNVPKIWKKMSEISKEYDLDLTALQSTIQDDVAAYFSFVFQEIKIRKTLVEKILKRNLKVKIPSYKTPKAKALKGDTQNPEARKALTSLIDVLWRWVMPITNYWGIWDMPDMAGAISEKLNEDFDQLSSAVSKYKRIDHLVGNFEYRVADLDQNSQDRIYQKMVLSFTGV